MKNKKYLKLIIIAGSGVFFILVGLLLWNLIFSKYKIFNDQEKLFLNAVERFYSLNGQYLPKKGETREMTLQYLYDGDHIDDLYIPKTNKLCDSNSWVRVYQDSDGKLHYNTYLKCGKYESKVDHDGPVITLNGNKQYVISVGSTYTELGVKSVEDDKDGKISNEKVVIDNSKVNTSKIGVYPVTYTVYDKNYNKTVVTRNVVVANNLTEVVRKNTDESNYYKGNSVNNYLLFSGMLFRIVNVNEDGSVKIISENSITNLRMDHSNYENSNVDTWLNKVFYRALNNSDKYLVDTTYCVNDINSMNDNVAACNTTVVKKVGLLSIVDYNKTILNNDSFLNNGNYFALGHKIRENYAAVPYDNSNINGLQSGILAGIRPVITLKNNLYLVSGDGSSENPYKLDDYSYAKKKTTINNRIVGEYVEYSGLTFRIIGIDENKNVKLIMSKPWNIQPTNDNLKLSVKNIQSSVFDLNDGNSPGYILNNNYIEYIDSTNIIEMKYDIPTNLANQKYTEYKKSKVSAKVFLPKSYELFSAVGSDSSNKIVSYLFIDRSSSDSLIYMLVGSNGLAYEMSKENFDNFSIKAVITVNGNLKITSGNGTINSPYILK